MLKQAALGVLGSEEHLDVPIGRSKRKRHLAAIWLVFLLGALPDCSDVSAETAESARPFAGPKRGAPVTTANSVSLPITMASSIQTKKDTRGDYVTLPDFAAGGAPGDPLLPVHRMCFLLPPDVDWSSIQVRVEKAVWEPVAGQFDLAPAQPATLYKGGNPVAVWEGKNPANIIAGRDVTVYNANADFPANPAGAVETSKYRQWNLVYVTLTPVAYNPVQKTLRLLRSGSVVVRFTRTGRIETKMATPAGSERFWTRIAPDLENADAAKSLYPAATGGDMHLQSDFDSDYVIITTAQIQSGSTKLDDFVRHKRLLGHTVHVITEQGFPDNLHYASGANANGRADLIRSWLKNRYLFGYMEYVLLIGDPNPTTFTANRSIPMKFCYPNPAEHAADDTVPTDMYFAELSGDWDRDGDGYPGEWGTTHDFAAGGIDRNCEVLVGRVPYYGTIADLDAILQKIITYESATTAEAWRKKILIPAAISNHSPEDHNNDGDTADAGEKTNVADRTFSADWGDLVKSLANSNGYTPYTLYEKSGIYANGSAYPLTACNAPLTDVNVRTEWANHYGLVTWWGHGSSGAVHRRVWSSDTSGPHSGDRITQHPEETTGDPFFDTGDCASLDDAYPSLVFQGSCNNGYPESSNNLAYRLLKRGAVATISGTRVTVYDTGAWNPGELTKGDNGSYGYYIPSRIMVNGDNFGEALHWCKANFGGAWGTSLWRNCLDYNIYGDPTETPELRDLCPYVTASFRWDSNPTNASPVNFIVLFSETVSGVSSADFTLTCSGVTGASIASVSGGPSPSYVVTVNTGSGSGTIQLSVNDDDTILDESSKPLGGVGIGNGGFTTGETYTIDRSRPTVTVEQAPGQEDPTPQDDSICFDITFSEPVTGFTESDVTWTGTATGVDCYTNIYSGTYVRIFVTNVATDGTLVPIIAANKVFDAAGNGNFASTATDNSVTLDRLRPSVTVNQETGQRDPTNGFPIRFSVRFSEPVSGFGAADVSFTGTATGVTKSLTGSGSSYTIVVTAATGDGTVIPSIASSKAADAAGNTNVASTSTDNQVTLERVAPTVTVNQMVGQPDPTNDFPIVFQVDFSEPVTGFTASDVTMDGTATGVVFSTLYSGGHYFIEVTAAASNGTIVPSIAAGRCTDLVGNANVASTSTDNSVTLDGVGPQVTIAQAPGQNDPTNAFPVRFSVTFTEAVTGLTASDFQWSGTAGVPPTRSLTGSGSSYTISANSASVDGTLIPVLAAGRCTDLAGNPNQASIAPVDGSVTVDRIAPTVTVNQMPGQSDPARSFPITFKAEFSEGVTGFTSGDVTIGGTATGVTFDFSQVGNTYFIEVTGAATDGTIIPSVASARCTDAAGNSNAASTSTDNSVTLDRAGPTVTVNQAVGQTDPTSVLPIAFTVHFSESVSNFATNDVTMGGTATGPTFNVSGSGTDYTINVTAVTGDGTLVPTIAAGRATDAAGNGNTASTSTDNSVLVEQTDPLVTSMVRSDANPTSAGLVRFRVGFSEPVTGVGTSDFTVAAGGVSGAFVSGVSGGPTTYTVTVNSGSGDGWVQLNLSDNDSIRDLASNPLGGPGAANGDYWDEIYEIDKTPPSVSGIWALDANPTSASLVRFQVSFDEPIRSLDAGDVRITSSGVVGASIAATTGSDSLWTVTVNTGTSGGTVRLDVADNDSIRDPAGNPLGGTGAGNGNFTAGESYEIDRTWPRVLSVIRTDPSPTNAASVTFEVTFSEAVSGVTVGDFWLSSSGGVSGATVTGVGAALGGEVWYVSVNTGTGNGVVQLRVSDDDSIRDVADNRLGGTGAGNGNFNTGESYVIDKTAPRVLSVARLNTNPTNAQTVRYRVTFSESVEGVWWNNFAPIHTGSVSGESATEFHGSGTSWTVTLDTGVGDGTIRLNISDNNGIYDAAFNPLGGPAVGDGTFTGGQIYTIDRTAPSVDWITLAGVNPTSTTSVDFSIRFSEPVSGVSVSDFALTVTGGVTGASVSSLSGGGMTGTVTVNTGSGDGTIRLDLVDDDSIRDQVGLRLGGTGAGNGNYTTGPAVTIDKTAPSVTINQAPGQSDPAATLPIRFAVQFSESVNGFGAGDLSFGGTASGVTYGISGSGSSYTVSITAVTTDGTIIPSVMASRTGDAAGNGNLVSSSTDNSVRLDRQVPTVVSAARADANPTSAGAVRFIVTFSESVTGVGTADFAVTPVGVGGASVTNVSGSGTTRTVTVATGTGDGTIRLDVADDDTVLDSANNPLGGPGAGNGGFTAGQFYTIDKTGPAVTINQAAGQSDPANVLPLRFSVLFSESVTGFAQGDVTFGGTATGVTYGITGSGSSYTVSVLTAATDGTVVPTIASSRAKDAAANGNVASTSTDNSVRLDRQAPAVVSVMRADANPTSAGAVRFIVTFTENVAGVGTGDFAVTPVGVGGASVTNVSGSGTTRTVTVATGTGDGTIRLDVADDDTVVDTAGNPLGGVGAGGGYQAGQSYTIDKTGPTCATPTDAGEFSSATAVTFTWTAGSDGGGCGIARYVLQIGTTPGTSNVLSADVGLATSRSVTGSHGQRLYARLRAMDAIGNPGNFSGSSDGILIDTAAPDTRATSPTGTVTEMVFRVAFTTTESGSGFRAVRLFYRYNGTGGFQPCGDSTTTSPITVDAALLGGRGTYEFYTIGFDRAGNMESAPGPPDITVTVDATTSARRWWMY